MPSWLMTILTAIGGIGFVVSTFSVLIPARWVEGIGKTCGTAIENLLHTKIGKKAGEVLGDKTIVAFARGLLKGMGEL